MSSLQAPAGLQPSASYSFTMRIELRQLPGAFAAVAHAIGAEGAILGAIDLVRVDQRGVVRDVTVACVDAAHGERVVAAVRALDGVNVPSVSDRTFLMHKGGKIEVRPKVAIKTRDDLSMAYTPGVARVSSGDRGRPGVRLDADDQRPLRRRRLRRDRRARAGRHRPRGRDARDGGQGDALQGARRRRRVPDLRQHHGRRRDRQARASRSRPTFGGINLEDIAAPRCFEIERRLKESLDIPVFHDDQHGTAVVVLAALLNALRVVGKRAEDVRMVIVGAGAAGLACAKIILEHGVKDLIVCDIGGILHPDRTEPDRRAGRDGRAHEPARHQGHAPTTRS